MTSDRIPLHVLTGFLGSGKTTLLNRVLCDPAWSDSAILINEIGDVSIDHHLVERIERADNLDVVVLKGGCTCCALRGDLVAALHELYARRAKDDVPPFARVVMETTGLADPAPVLFTLFSDVTLRYKFERGAVVATFDAVHGLAQLVRHPETRKQIAVADRVVLTKTDLEGAESSIQLSEAIRRVNPLASVLDARDAMTPGALLEHARGDLPALDRAYETHKPEYWRRAIGPRMLQRQRSRKLAEKLGGPRPDLEHSRFVADAPQAEHSLDTGSIAIVLDEPVPWSAFAVWLSLLMHAHGQKLLQFKALLDVAGWPNPVVLDAVHAHFSAASMRLDPAAPHDALACLRLAAEQRHPLRFFAEPIEFSNSRRAAPGTDFALVSSDRDTRPGHPPRLVLAREAGSCCPVEQVRRENSYQSGG